jgi:soluble P-type ATPase
MFSLDIPGFKSLNLEHLILDFNGTLAVDGAVVPGVRELVTELSQKMKVHVLTADTQGTCRAALEGWPVDIHVLEARRRSRSQGRLPDRVRAAITCAAMGNGRNDQIMLQAAALGVAVMGDEGAAPAAIAAGDVFVGDIISGLELLAKPKRLLATLRR